MKPIIRRGGLSALALAGLLLGAQAAAQPAPASEPTVVPIQLYEFRYDPTSIDLQQGHAYVFRITNDGNAAHDLSAKTFFESVSLATGSADKLHNGSVELAKGASVDIAFTPNTAGAYEMHCTHPLHSMLGMKGKIVVH